MCCLTEATQALTKEMYAQKFIPLMELKENRKVRFRSSALVLLYCSTSAMPEVQSESVACPGRLTGTDGGTPVWPVCIQQAAQARVGLSVWAQTPIPR